MPIGHSAIFTKWVLLIPIAIAAGLCAYILLYFMWSATSLKPVSVVNGANESYEIYGHKDNYVNNLSRTLFHPFVWLEFKFRSKVIFSESEMFDMGINADHLYGD